MYTTIFVLLILGGIGFPMPEEVPIIIAGVGSAQGKVSIELAFLICYVGVLIGDQMMYCFGYYFGKKLLAKLTASPFFPSVTDERVNDVREGLRKRRLLYLFLGRHLFVLRSVTFVVAGALRVPFLEFFAADALAALFSVTVFMALGYVLGETLSPEAIAQETKLAIAVLAVLVSLFWIIRSKRNKHNQAVKAADLGDTGKTDEPALPQNQLS